jgi:hypothetical protein
LAFRFVSRGRSDGALRLQATANYRADLNRAAAAKYAALAAGIQKKAKQNGVVPKKKTRRS